MSHWSLRQETTNDDVNYPLAKIETYADAILRTLSSLKPPSPISLYSYRRHRHSHSQSKTVSQSFVNEVSGIKTCINLYT